jgi:hypothetical protein
VDRGSRQRSSAQGKSRGRRGAWRFKVAYRGGTGDAARAPGLPRGRPVPSTSRPRGHPVAARTGAVGALWWHRRTVGVEGAGQQNFDHNLL